MTDDILLASLMANQPQQQRPVQPFDLGAALGFVPMQQQAAPPPPTPTAPPAAPTIAEQRASWHDAMAGTPSGPGGSPASVAGPNGPSENSKVAKTILATGGAAAGTAIGGPVGGIIGGGIGSLLGSMF